MRIQYSNLNKNIRTTKSKQELQNDDNKPHPKAADDIIDVTAKEVD